MNLGVGFKASYSCRAASGAPIRRPIKCSSRILPKIFFLDPDAETRKNCAALFSFSMELFSVIFASITKILSVSAFLARQDPVADTLGCLDLELHHLDHQYKHLDFGHFLNHLIQVECRAPTQFPAVRVNLRNPAEGFVHFHEPLGDFDNAPSVVPICSCTSLYQNGSVFETGRPNNSGVDVVD